MLVLPVCVDSISTGSVAGFACCFITSPSELLKCRMQIVGQGHSKPFVRLTTLQCVRDIVQQRGLGGLGQVTQPFRFFSSPPFCSLFRFFVLRLSAKGNVRGAMGYKESKAKEPQMICDCL